MGSRQVYFSYMLRLWRGPKDGDSSWHASLEDPQTGERHGFADLGALFGYLTNHTEQRGDSRSEPPADPADTGD